ncbi:hypothetical protein FRC00_004643 [Tulasnella sp. 408]|nr:hypothetical protein FRC00_004643 [Tulasnella sp. 408]
MNVLPKEIFIAIVTCIIQDLRPSDYRHAIGNLRMVCVGWNKWIETTPGLWSVIDFGGWSYTTIQQHLARVEGAALSVHHKTNTGRADREKFRQTTVPTLSRCRALNLHLPLDLFPDLAGTPAPVLLTARLSFFPTLKTVALTRPIDLFASNAPLLENICIFEAPVRWESPIFAGLRCLKLSHILGNSPVTHLVDILLRCPQLSTLHITNCYIEDGRVASGQAVPIYLPALEVFHFVIAAPDVLVYILENIEALPTREITLRPDQITEERLARRLQSAAGTLFNRAKDTLGAMRSVEITVFSERGDCLDALSYAQTGQQFILSLGLEGPSSVSWTSWFSKGILPSFQDGVELSVTLCNGKHEAVLSDFGPLPQVKTLNIEASHDSVVFVEWMSIPAHIPDEDGGAQKNVWPFPGLRELYVYDGIVDGTDLLTMLESRYRLRGVPEIANGTQAAAPPALKSVRLPYIQKIAVASIDCDYEERAIFRDIERVLGEGVLQFGSGQIEL